MKNLRTISGLGELNSFQSQEINLRNSMDRYGFSYLLANHLGMNSPWRAFCDWVHGWVWWEDIMGPKDILSNYLVPNDISIVVATQNQKKVISDHGYNNSIFVGGLPYAYCPDVDIPKCQNVLLAILPHSAESQDYDVFDKHYLDYLHAIKDNWESIFVSIFYLDENERLISEIERRGLKVVIGANPNDRYSMLRTQLMFNLADAVNSNVMGSHIAYALASNCKVSLVDDLYTFDQSINMKANPHLIKEDVDKFLFVNSSEYLKDQFKYLFVDPALGERNKKLGDEYIGRENVLENIALKHAIGWNFKQQLNGFFSGFYRRASRIFKDI
tara:strand:+ start:768 stop:1754 length:987 start_codon:yes stop_codon:yes gene_type:complete